MPIIYHITTQVEWDQAKAKGYYEAMSLPTEGFIHCSELHQVNGVLGRYFEGKSDLVRLEIDTEKLTSKYVFDWSPSTKDTFPHIYGPINSEAVLNVTPL
ncbi:MAG: DUF952 domain-containing protein [Chitinophagaceae bacterium]|nr:DUF952 domain-containing protein [Chitinophagaceae bacterium]